MPYSKEDIKRNIVFFKKIPLFPNTVRPSSIGMKNCNVPTASLLAEDDDGNICFMSQSDKQRTLEYYEKMYNEFN